MGCVLSLISPEDVDRIVREVRPTTSVLDLINRAQAGLKEWLCLIINSTLSFIGHYACLLHLYLKKPTLSPADIGNFHPVSNLPVWGKVIEQVVAVQLPQFLEDTVWIPFRLASGLAMVREPLWWLT